MSGYVNPMFRLFEGQLNDESITSYQWTRFTPEENDISRASLNRISIKTKDLDSYLDICKAYLSVTFHLADNDAGTTLVNTDNATLGSVLAGIFRKLSLSLNSVVLNENDNIQFNMQIQQMLNWSQNYQDKHGRELGMFWDSAANNTGATLLTNARASHGFELIKGAANSTAPRRIQFKIPLAQVFGFVRSFTGLLRGCELRIDLEKEETVGRYVFGGGAAACEAGIRAVLDELELWIPRVVPSLESEKFYLDNLNSNKVQTIVYEDAVTYINSVTAVNNYFSLQVQSNSRKPRFIFCSFKNADRFKKLIGNNVANHCSLFDPNGLESIQLRINSENLPREPLRLNFSDSTLAKAQDASRAYRDFVELMQGGEYDNGSLVRYDDYIRWYPIICWDLSRERSSLFQNLNNNYIEIVAPRIADGQVNVFTTIIWEREVELKASNRSLEIKRI